MIKEDTAVALSPAEAMKLPIEQRPLCFRIPETLYHAVFEAIGAASMCWNPKPSTQIFDSNLAAKIATNLCSLVARELEDKTEEKKLKKLVDTTP